MFSSSLYADWTEMSENTSGTAYVDFERTRKHDGYVYYWYLGDYAKPTELGHLSSKSYRQGDCKLFRFKGLSFSFHKEPMGGGNGDVEEPDTEWTYPSPNSSFETVLKKVCNR
jgi:hypothetical protein